MAKSKGNKNNIAGAPQAIYKFAIEAYDELKKVAWPTRQTTLRYTGIVVVTSLIVGMIIGGIDLLLQKVLAQFI